MLHAWSKRTLLGLVVLCWAQSTPAQLSLTSLEATKKPSNAVPAVADSAVLMIYNRPIFVYRAWFGASSPEDRAANARRHIDTLLKTNPNATIGTRKSADGMLITIGDRPIFTVTPADADTLLGETVEQVSHKTALALGEAFAAAAKQRAPGRLLRSTLLAILATFILVLGLRVLVKSYGRMNRWFEQRSQKASDRLNRTAKIVDLTQVRNLQRGVVAVGLTGIALLLLDMWLLFILRRFPYTTPWGNMLRGRLLAYLGQIGLSIVEALPGLLVVGVIFVCTRIIGRWVDSFLRAVESGSITLPWIHAETALPTRRIAPVILWLLAIMVAYPYVPGSGSGVFKGVSLFTGLLLSLGSSTFIGQAMSGFVLMYSRSLKAGEFVRIHDVEGVVEEVGVLATKLQTYQHEIITIPNSVVVNGMIKNNSRLASDPKGVLADTTVTIGYDAPWRLVHSMLLDAAAKTPGLRRDPEPFVFQTSLADFYVEYRLHVALENPLARRATMSVLHANIQDAFNTHGVQIMSPHFEGQPEGRVLSPPDQWSGAVEKPKPGKPRS